MEGIISCQGAIDSKFLCMSLKKLISGFALASLLALGVGAGLSATKENVAQKAEAATATTVFCAITDAQLGSNASMKLNINYKGDGDDWDALDMQDTGATYDGKKVFVCNFTDKYDGLGAIQFQVYRSGEWADQDQVFGTKQWTSPSTYNNKLRVYKGSDWVEGFNPIQSLSLIGAYGEYNWDHDEALTINDGVATLNSVVLAKGDTLKIRANAAWAYTYGWSNANGHISTTDEWSRGEDCFADAGSDNNIAVLHDGTYNFSLNISSGVLTITGARAQYDTELCVQIWISNGGAYVPTNMALKPESTTEYLITRDFVAGEKFYFKFGAGYYHYSEVKDGCSLKGTQFVAAGNDIQALYNGNYTIYYETQEGGNYGAWLQYNSTSAAQIRANVISFATYFNDQVGGACDDQGGDGSESYISGVQTAWQNASTRFTNSPNDDVKDAIKEATASDEDNEVKEFVGKYNKVYYLRGSVLGSHGGDFLAKGITPKSSTTFAPISLENSGSNNTMLIVVITISAIALIGVGAYFYLRKRKED